PKLEDWPDITWEAGENTRRVNLDTITKEEVQEWKTGETVLLSGKILTGRDAAHKRIQGMLDNGEGLPEGVDLNGKFIYYVGPVDAVG
ncbi:fumarate hydratase C-terminal domain-containing protein, partial [Vibrio diabolicus]